MRRLLIANRGEIACRIMRTAQRMGVTSIAVFSDADRGARHVRVADESYWLGAAPAADSYLNTARIIAVARSAGADCVHPGYGFLSENAAFAQACIDAGLTFVGPPPAAIRAMGSKSAAKSAMSDAGVPGAPGYHGEDQSIGRLCTEAVRIGFPLIIKASAGGGGKGMQVVESAAQVSGAVESAQRLARAAFGDGRLLLERYFPHARHVEVQILADRHGTVLPLFDRDCSIQRRHQKVIEEAPAPGIRPEVRAAMAEAAVRTARAVDYSSAGTVEFLMDDGQQFYFMEMNTRLQVEHPVTEMVTGLDLVEQQLRVASGEHLGEEVLNARIQGHSVEARIYAESPSRGFLPTSGRVLEVREPSGEGVRVDSALLGGLNVGTDYDPMLAKVVAWGPDRASALTRIERALEDTVIFGVVTNVGFLRRLVAEPDVVIGRLDTGLIERESTSLVSSGPSYAALALYALSWMVRLTPKGNCADPWESLRGWRNGGRIHPLNWRIITGETLSVVEASGTLDGATVSIDGVRVVARLAERDGDTFLTIDDETHRAWFRIDGATTWVCVGGETWPIVEDVASRIRGAADSSNDVRSPMPGTVVSVPAPSGHDVRKGQPLVVVSAMKMEHVLVAPRDGTVDILVREGDSVNVDEVVARLLPPSAATEVSS